MTSPRPLATSLAHQQAPRHRGKIGRRIVALLASSAVVSGCDSFGTVQIRGRVEDASVREIRYMLDRNYGLSPLDMASSREALERKAGAYESLFPDAEGYFSTADLPVVYDTLIPLHPPLPVFWLTFSNEHSVVYGVGPVRYNTIDYATFDVETRAKLDRNLTCWIVRSGKFTRPEVGRVVLSIVLVPNLAATKDCRDQ
jgi:hypothetical protein